MCNQCEKKPVYEFTNKRKVCARCFVKYFDKKARYIIRKFKMIKPGEIIGYENKKDFRGVVLEHVLKIFAEYSGIEIVKLSSKKKVDKVAISSTIDLEADKIIHCFVEGDVKKLKSFAVEGRIIKPLYLFLNEEVLLYAKLRKLKFKKTSENKDEISRFLGNLEKKHPEVKRAIVNSWLELNK
ncbi:MAG: hypothetical protein KKF68_02260 [Nanoarchaeota archaeon]|nr:hypothetical protein [Nanoarchaeota archaeon]